MDTVTLVNEQLTDGERLLKHLSQNGFEVAAAFWLKTTDDIPWHYFVASPVVETEGPMQAYMQLDRIIRQMPQPFTIDPLKVRLIAPSDPVARDVLNVPNLSSGSCAHPIRWSGIRLGNLSIEGAYLYPLPATASSGC